MDFNAIQYASDEILEEYGLKAAGQRFSLRWFCQTQIQDKSRTGESSNESKEARKRRLLEELRKKSKRNANVEQVLNTPQMSTGKSRKIQLGWMHYSGEKGKYVPVRLQSGGGTRDISMNVNATADDIIKEAIKLFYPNGMSMCHGMASRMKLELGNFKGELVHDDHSQVHHETQIFTLQNYIATNKLSRVRLYLMSKERNEEEQVLEIHDNSSSDEDFEHITMFSGTGHVNDPEEEPQPFNSTIGTLSTSVDANSNIHKISSSSCTETLPTDQQSSAQPKDLCIETDNYAIRIQAARASRVLPEPDFTTTTDAVVVAVRHIDLGVITRCFRSSETITAVYDWVGSLQAEPVNFVLCNALSPGHGVDPSSSVCTVAKTMLTMSKEQNCPYLIHSEPEISMEGFSHISDFDIQEITSLPPLQIFDDDLR